MSLQITLNLIIAFMWMFLTESYQFPSFLTGFIIGAFLLFLLRRFIPSRFYLYRVWKFVSLILLFIKELIKSNVSIVKLVYQPKRTYNPGIFALPIDLKTNWEIAILTSLISLTPGTLSVAISDDNSLVYIHAMDLQDDKKEIESIKDSFEKAIMEVTR
ncbi:multicomponent Na+:H+ antiporter subunit E [Gracilibacillus halotolerans]|uniref:Multicomponent Na+:H+ antiporter subunit E n=1 Tax=Gracilibacillus halotolerans TaxID=74386 RepID=A0A841RIP5_9BACI|nr:Na+/H+ antiporter subunit E [Gracilibacillus halotolerans]MBB6511882.1 multicomponent Na+:H+ antiporter subunit E [Gracilibacillus halotolerans]